MAFLSIVNISKSYPDLPVLHDISLDAEAREIICLLGPSGCGKSTLLRIIAGLEAPDSGQVLRNGVNLAPVPAHQRQFSLMFQDYALFPHKDVGGNVAFGLRMRNWPQREIQARVKDMLELVELQSYERRRVGELSGGEQQRVALARSLAPAPHLLLLDEPLGALDRTLREQLMNDLRDILKRVGVTAIYVTHDQEEAFAIADRVLIMQARLEAGEGGRIVQSGTPQEVYRHPASLYVARFLGFRNFLAGSVLEVLPATADEPATALNVETRAGSPCEGRRPMGDSYLVDTPLGFLIVDDPSRSYSPGARVTLLVRPEAATISPAGIQAGEPNLVAGELMASSFRGSYCLITVRHASGAELICEASPSGGDLPRSGEQIVLSLDPRSLAFLDD